MLCSTKASTPKMQQSKALGYKEPVKLLVFILLYLSVTGLVIAETKEQYLAEMGRLKKEALSKIDMEECEKQGGEIIEVGLLELPTCIYSYKDAGKECHNSSECEGRCESRDVNIESWVSTTGVCQEQSFAGGCFSEIENGVAMPVICID